MAGTLYLNNKEILRLKNSLWLVVYNELSKLILEKKLSLNESLLKLLSQIDQDTRFFIGGEITKSLKNCSDFNLFISLLDPLFAKMEAEKKYYPKLEQDLLFFKESLENYAREKLCTVS